MGVSGQLSDISLIDVFKIVRSRTGELHLSLDSANQLVDIGLHTNHLVSLSVSGHPVTDRQETIDTISNLIHSNNGSFRFTDTGRRPGTFLIPLYPIVLAAAQQQTVPDAELPHPDTRFRLADTTQPVPTGLQSIWSDLLPLLRLGTSASEASALLGRPLRDCQVMLYRCRAAGLTVLNPKPTEAFLPTDERSAGTLRSTLNRFITRLRQWRSHG